MNVTKFSIRTRNKLELEDHDHLEELDVSEFRISRVCGPHRCSTQL